MTLTKKKANFQNAKAVVTNELKIETLKIISIYQQKLNDWRLFLTYVVEKLKVKPNKEHSKREEIQRLKTTTGREED